MTRRWTRRSVNPYTNYFVQDGRRRKDNVIAVLDVPLQERVTSATVSPSRARSLIQTRNETKTRRGLFGDDPEESSRHAPPRDIGERLIPQLAAELSSARCAG